MGDGAHYYADGSGDYVSYDNYLTSPVPYDATPVCPLPDGPVDGAYA